MNASCNLANSYNAAIGVNGAGGFNFFNGTIDEVMIFNKSSHRKTD